MEVKTTNSFVAYVPVLDTLFGRRIMCKYESFPYEREGVMHKGLFATDEKVPGCRKTFCMDQHVFVPPALG